MKMSPRFSVYVALLVVLISAPMIQAHPQASLVINGFVQDQTGAALVGAQIDLLQDGKEQRTVTTDARAHFVSTGFSLEITESVRTKKDSRQTFLKSR
jgi:hypothetical protein